jgi:hypothetical protein
LEAPSNDKRAHLRTVRSIANRMQVGSSITKVWSIAVVAALLAVATNPAHARFAWLALFMTLAFWMLDAYFSRQAWLFRKMYERVLSLPESELDFDMSTAPVDDDATAFSTIFLSKALGAYYGTIVALIILVRLLLARSA